MADQKHIARMQKENGCWRRYFVRIVNYHKRRQTISAKQVQEIYDRQEGKCAFTGLPMTCHRGRPNLMAPLNASMDRIIPGGLYTVENVQLVCVALNVFRGVLSIPDFIRWCHRVAAYLPCPSDDHPGLVPA